jgi:hypothetical protein
LLYSKKLCGYKSSLRHLIDKCSFLIDSLFSDKRYFSAIAIALAGSAASLGLGSNPT